MLEAEFKNEAYGHEQDNDDALHKSADNVSRHATVSEGTRLSVMACTGPPGAVPKSAGNYSSTTPTAMVASSVRGLYFSPLRVPHVLT